MISCHENQNYLIHEISMSLVTELVKCQNSVFTAINYAKIHYI